MKRQYGKCPRCGVETDLTRDHRIPKSFISVLNYAGVKTPELRNGKSKFGSNYQWMCVPCNVKKGNTIENDCMPLALEYLQRLFTEGRKLSPSQVKRLKRIFGDDVYSFYELQTLSKTQQSEVRDLRGATTEMGTGQSENPRPNEIIKVRESLMEKTEEQFKDWITYQINHYLPILGLQLHRIEIEKNEKETTYLGIKCAYPYLDPMLYYHENAFKSWVEGKLEADRILHELCHIITDPLYCKATQRYVSQDEIKDERERLTDTIAAIIRRMDK